MSNVRRIARNTTVLLLSNIASFVIGFFFTMYVARYLGAEGFGILSFALAFTAMFGVFTDIGVQGLMIREIARDKSLAPKFMGNIAVLKIFLTIITFGLIALIINLLNYPWQTIQVVYLMALSLVLNAFSTMFYSVFRANERMEFEAIGQVLGSAITLGGAFWAISHDYSVVGFAFIYFIVGVIILVYSLAVSGWKFTMPAFEVDLGFWKETIKQAWPFAISAIFVSLYYSVDSVMLSLMKGDAAVGWYSAAYRLVFLFAYLFGVYSITIFPIMSRFYTDSKYWLRFTYERTFKYMLVLAIPVGAGMTLLANKIIMLIFGFWYVNSVAPLQILVWSIVLLCVSSPFFLLLNALNKQILASKAIVIGGVLNVILNLLLIPRYSYIGASIATIVTQFLSFGLSYFWCSKAGYEMPKNYIAGLLIKVCVSCAIMCAFVVILKNFYIFALIPMSALLYFAVLYVIGVIDKEDTGLFRSLFGQNPPKAIESDDSIKPS